MMDEGQAPLEVISRIWAELLGVERVSLEDNFFALGGDSILVTIMALQVEEALGFMISADLVFDHPTLEGFAAAVTKEASLQHP